MKVHINNEGNPGECHANIGKCPFGTSDEHYSSFEEARLEYNKTMNMIMLPKTLKKENVKAKLLKQIISDAENAENMLNTHFQNKTELSGLEYEKHKKYVSSIINLLERANKTTDNEFQLHDPISGKTFYSHERALQHKEIVDELLDKYKNVPSEGKVLFSGGLGGAGKTTVLTQFAKINLEEYATINPDDVKEIMAKKNMIPKVLGLTAMESSPLAHEESSYIAKIVLDLITKEKKNIIFDMTMGYTDSVTSRLPRLQENDYSKPDVIFVDIEPQTSLSRADYRHRIGLKEYTVDNIGQGGRFLPERIVKSQEVENEKINSQNSIIFSKLVQDGIFNKVSVYDNNVNGREPIKRKASVFIKNILENSKK